MAKETVNETSLKTDASSGLAVFLVAVPLCLGIAHASGAPLLSGLISGIIGGLVTGYFSGSHLSVSGPAAGLTTIVLAANHQLGDYSLTLVAVFLAGLMQLLFGKLKLGSLSRLFPSSVIHGMLCAIGLILISKQFPHMLGFDREQFGVQKFSEDPADLTDSGPPESNTFSLIQDSLSLFTPGSLAIGCICLALLFFWEKRMAKKYPTLPGSLIAVVFAVAASFMLSWTAYSLPGDHLVQLPALNVKVLLFPDFSALKQMKVYTVAITIALVASLESLLSLDAIDRLDPKHRFSPPNKELIAQGIGNCLSGLLGGLPITSVIVRGSVNVNAGATSKASAILHGCYLLFAVLFLRSAINSVPLAALAAVLVFTGFKLAHPNSWKAAYHHGWAQFIPFVVTTLTVLFTDLLVGISVGLATSALFVLRNLHRASGFDVFHHRHRVKVRLHQEVTFFHKASLSKALEEIPDGSLVEIDGSRSITIDTDVLDAIEQFQLRAPRRNIQVFIGGIPSMHDSKLELEQRLEQEMQELIDRNQRWTTEKSQQDSNFFERQNSESRPLYLFVVCTDSMVPASTFTQTPSSQILAHRNIGHMVSAHDPNFMATLQYCVDILNIHHIVVCGHYGCQFIDQVLSAERNTSQVENWLWPIQNLIRKNQAELDAIADPSARARRIVELHTLEQSATLIGLPMLERSRERVGLPRIHAWVYDEATGGVTKLTRATSQKSN
jgi:carbonic anhydrase